MNKKQLISIAENVRFNGLVGGWVIDSAYKQCEDLDGTHAREYLESKGFEVIKNYDTGNNGLAITSCGIQLSTNGRIKRR